MRRKRNNKSDVLIDLTSLLDVIFIVLLIVLCGQSKLKNDLKDRQAAEENAQSNAEATQKIYEDMIDTANNINNYIMTTSVAVPYNKTEVRKREIKILVEGKEMKSFSLNGIDTEEPFDDFKSYLSEYVNQYKDKPVILSLNDDDDKILYRDEVAVNRIFDELSNEFDNVYIKSHLSEEEE